MTVPLVILAILSAPLAISVGTGGHQWGPIYLLIRAPLQLVLVAWTYWFAVR